MPSTPKKTTIPASLIPDNAALGGGLESEDLSFRQAIRIVRKRKHVVIWTVLVIGIVTLAVSFILQSYYSSNSSIEIQKQQSDLGTGSLGALAGSLGGEDDVKTQIETEVSVLQSDDLGIQTIERIHFEDHQKKGWDPLGLNKRDPQEVGLPLNEAPKIRERLLKHFEDHLTITPVPDTRLIQVVFEDPDSKYAADTVNALIDQYVQDRLARRNLSTVQASGWMSGEIDDLKKQVQVAEENLIDYQRKSGLIVMPSAGGGSSTQPGGSATTVTSPVIDRLTQLNTNLVSAESNRITQEALYQLAKAGDVDSLATMAAGMQSGGASGGSSMNGLFDGLLALRQQETTLKLQLTTALQSYGTKNPHLVDLNNQLDAIHLQMKDELKRIVNTTEMNYKVAQETEDGIRKAYKVEEQEAYKMNDSEIRLAVLQQEADSTRALYEDLYTKLQESKLSEGTQSSNVAIISRALPPHKPLHPKKLLNTGIGVLAGLVLGVIATFLLDTLDDTVATSSELEKLTGIPVLAAIPQFNTSFNPLTGRLVHGAAAANADVSQVAKMNSQASEAYRALRTTILLSQPGTPPRALLLTSALAAEGKTTTCYELGACFAIMGTKVLVIDADLRRPTVHRQAGIPNTKGLSNLLTSTAVPGDSIVEDSNVPNLFVLPSGPVPPNPAELLGSKVFDNLLESLIPQFDLVLIDSPPAMVVADAFIISVKVDGVVIVARAGSTTRSALSRVVENFRRNNANVLGFALNAVNTQSTEYYYDQGYYGKDYLSEEENEKRKS